MPDLETENQFPALPLWPEQYQYFRHSTYTYAFIFSFQMLRQDTPVPIVGLRDNNRYMCRGTALCLVGVRRVEKLWPSYVHQLRSHSS